MNRDTGETFLKFFNKVLNHLCSLAFLTRSSKWPADNKADHRVTVLEAGDDIQHFIRRKCPDGIGNGTEKIRPCHTHALGPYIDTYQTSVVRSEERRVGKECRYRRGASRGRKRRMC